VVPHEDARRTPGDDNQPRRPVAGRRRRRIEHLDRTGTGHSAERGIGVGDHANCAAIISGDESHELPPLAARPSAPYRSERWVKRAPRRAILACLLVLQKWTSTKGNGMAVSGQLRKWPRVRRFGSL